MEPEQTVAGTHPAFHSLHLTPEELAQPDSDELLQACLEYHRLLQTIMGILTTPDASLTMRVKNTWEDDVQPCCFCISRI
jgi:hypothetical protein